MEPIGQITLCLGIFLLLASVGVILLAKAALAYSEYDKDSLA